MNGLERVTRALQIQEPDRVPFFEPPSWKIMGEVVPGGSYEDVIEHFDLDAVMIDDRANERYLCEQIDDVLFRNQWGTVVQMAAEALPHPVDGPISSENDLDEWTPPDPDAPWRFEVLEAVVKRYKGEKAIIASFADPFNVANEMRGASDHYMDFVRNPRLVDRLAGVITDYYLRYLRNCIAAGADIIFITGDYATTKWPMLSPDHFAKHVIPYLKTLVDASIEGGVLTMKHTDGNIMPILDQIVDTGIHGLHPIDPNAGMDLGQMKKDYGDRLCLIGNVDCAHVLTWGSVEEVRQDVKRCIRQAARGGGFICMSSNSIHSGVTAERYVAMVDAIREYGQYPIAV
jgi:uroporphyrinogen decarboxylase